MTFRTQSHVLVLPSIYGLWTERCVASMSPELLGTQSLVIDNSEKNLGVARSWNLGVERMYDVGADWLVICSAACRFGVRGGEDLLDALEEHEGALAVEAAHGIGWHLIAIARSTFDAVGRFDENYWPAYMEDIDFGRRVHCWLGDEPPWWPKVSIDVAIAGFSHGVDLGGAVVHHDRLEKYYRQKWGGGRGEERYCQPFGNKSLSYWPEP